jgi:cell division protein FtsB
MRARSGGDGAGPKPSTKGVGLVETAFRRKAFALAAFLIAAATMLNSLFGEGGILGLWKAREAHARLVQEVEALETENARLSAQIRALRSDPLVVERLARETLGMSRPGEIVLTIRHPELR